MSKARAFLDNLRAEQMKEYSHDEFVKVLKDRIRRWSGDHSIMFASEEEVVAALKKMNN